MADRLRSKLLGSFIGGRPAQQLGAMAFDTVYDDPPSHGYAAGSRFLVAPSASSRWASFDYAETGGACSRDDRRWASSGFRGSWAGPHGDGGSPHAIRDEEYAAMRDYGYDQYRAERGRPVVPDGIGGPERRFGPPHRGALSAPPVRSAWLLDHVALAERAPRLSLIHI